MEESDSIKLPKPPSLLVWLETSRLCLRRLIAEDFEWAWQFDCDPEVMRFISFGVPTPRDVFEQVYFPRMLQNYPQGTQFGFWAVKLRQSESWIGWFHLRPEKQEPFEMELGYRLCRNVWGKGLATEGSREFLRYAFLEWGMPRVVAHTLTANTASRRVMEKCGMRWERDFICPEAWIPGTTEQERRSVRYAISASEFKMPAR